MAILPDPGWQPFMVSSVPSKSPVGAASSLRLLRSNTRPSVNPHRWCRLGSNGWMVKLTKVVVICEDFRQSCYKTQHTFKTECDTHKKLSGFQIQPLKGIATTSQHPHRKIWLLQWALRICLAMNYLDNPNFRSQQVLKTSRDTGKNDRKVNKF